MALHRFSVLLAICTLFLIIAGASVTSNQAGLSVPDWPLSYGQVMPEMAGGVFYEHGHRMIASTVGLFTVILAVWLWRRDDRIAVRRLGWGAVVVVILQGVLGGVTVLYMLPPLVSISHACLAQIFFCMTIAMAMFTSEGWYRGPVEVEDHGWPSLRSLAMITPVLVLLQIALGAGYRHRAIGVMPHVLGAIVIGTMIMAFAVFVLVQFPEHKPLRRTAWALLSITCIQLLLGIAAYLFRVTAANSTTPEMKMVLSTVIHVGFGALTMGATAALAIQVLRHVKARAAEATPGRLPAVSR
jgi:heme a synthase